MALFSRLERKYTQAELDKAVADALAQQGFDFSQLWIEPEAGGGLMKFIPVFNFIILIIVLAVSFLKK